MNRALRSRSFAFPAKRNTHAGGTWVLSERAPLGKEEERAYLMTTRGTSPDHVEITPALMPGSAVSEQIKYSLSVPETSRRRAAPWIGA